MTPREYWNIYVEKCGGIPAMAKNYGLNYSTLAGIHSGARGCGRKLASNIKRVDPLADAGMLAMVGPIHTE